LSADCVRTGTGGRIDPPRKIADVRPRYPESLTNSGAEALVVLNTIISADGFVRDVRAADRHVHPDFLAAAIEGVQQVAVHADALELHADLMCR
jgi:hypothetical protein